MPNPAPAKLTITAYSDNDFSSKVSSAQNPFTVWMNPASYTRKTSVCYNDRQAQGSPGPSPEFNRVSSDDVTFELMFDATGVVPLPNGNASYTNGVADAIEQLTTLAATLNGAIHSPNYLILSWAQLQFHCVLASMNTKYTLFRPDGTPLRAKVTATFKSYNSEALLAKSSNKQSPDVTHMVMAQAGDTLPALCFQIYGDSRFYFKVAAFNGLVNFRDVRPGTQLLFPPLTGSNS